MELSGLPDIGDRYKLTVFPETSISKFKAGKKGTAEKIKHEYSMLWRTWFRNLTDEFIPKPVDKDNDNLFINLDNNEEVDNNDHNEKLVALAEGLIYNITYVLLRNAELVKFNMKRYDSEWYSSEVWICKLAETLLKGMALCNM